MTKTAPVEKHEKELETRKIEEQYPNFAKLTALLNQQEKPRHMLRMLVDICQK